MIIIAVIILAIPLIYQIVYPPSEPPVMKFPLFWVATTLWPWAWAICAAFGAHPGGGGYNKTWENYRVNVLNNFTNTSPQKVNISSSYDSLLASFTPDSKFITLDVIFNHNISSLRVDANKN